MSWPDELRARRDGVTIPTFWVTLVLSLLIHALVLWQWLPKIRFPSLTEPERAASSGALAVRLAPPQAPPPAPVPPPSPAQPTPSTPPVPLPRAVTRTPPAPPVIASSRPAPDTPPSVPVAPPVSAPAPAATPSGGDLASFIESQRRARATPQESPSKAPPADDDKSRSNRVAAANVASPRIMTFGYDPNRSGGVFKVQRTGLNDAEFMFYGWNPDARRNTAQLIEVKKGNNSDIRIAVVRKMIAIIRDSVQEEDFLWDSKRLGRSLTLSARARDNEGLEEFMLREIEF